MATLRDLKAVRIRGEFHSPVTEVGYLDNVIIRSPLVITSAPVVITIVGTNRSPTISSIAGQTILEDTASGAISFTLYDAETPADKMLASASSWNEGLIPTRNIKLQGSGTNWTVTALPATNQFSPPLSPYGAAPILITVTDADGATIGELFHVTVTPVNDAPTLDVIADHTVDEDAPEQLVQLTGITAGPANETQSLTVTATSDNLVVIPNPTVTYTSPNTNGTLRFRPLPNANGVAIITVTVKDNGERQRWNGQRWSGYDYQLLSRGCLSCE